MLEDHMVSARLADVDAMAPAIAPGLPNRQSRGFVCTASSVLSARGMPSPLLSRTWYQGRYRTSKSRNKSGRPLLVSFQPTRWYKSDVSVPPEADAQPNR